MKGTLKEVADDVHHVADGGDDVGGLEEGAREISNRERSEGIRRARRPFRWNGGRRSSWRWKELLVGLEPSAIMWSFFITWGTVKGRRISVC